MRKVIARGFVLEFASLVALIISVVPAWLSQVLELSAAAAISAFRGLSVAVARRA